MRLKLILLTTTLFLSACFPTSFEAVKPNGDKFEVLFYPGGEVIDDLLIIEEQNYFGTAQYQIDDPLGDLGFRLKDGTRFQAECTSIGKDIIGDDECKLYEVYRSTFSLFPVGTQIPRPQMF